MRLQLQQYRSLPPAQQEQLLEELDNFESWLEKREEDAAQLLIEDTRTDLGIYCLHILSVLIILLASTEKEQEKVIQDMILQARREKKHQDLSTIVSKLDAVSKPPATNCI
jgi:hypothetical protein